MAGHGADNPQEKPKPTDGTAPAGDNLQGARMPAAGDNKVVAQNTADPHLPNIGIDTPYNPYKLPGQYQKADIDAAKAAGFNQDEVHALEEGGGDRFHQTMAYLKARPDKMGELKTFADTVVSLQGNPDQIYNPAKVPGQYRQDALEFGKKSGFNSDQMHVMEEWGPNNFNGIMDYLKQNPNQIENFKNLANAVGYWQMHPDMPMDPKAQHSPINPDAVKFAESQGFNKGQMAILGQWGADNFNNTMDYLKKNPEHINDFKNLANAVGTWEMQAAQQLGQQGAPAQGRPKR